MSKYLFWRGSALWSRFPRPDKPKGHRYPLGLKAPGDGSKAACEKRAMSNGYLPLVAEPNQKLFEKHEPEVEPYRPKFSYLCDRFTEHVASLKSVSVKGTILQLKKHFGDRYWDELSKDEVNIWTNNLLKTNYAVATIKSYSYWLKRVYQHATEESDIRLRLPRNPLEKIKAPKIKSAIRDHYVPPDCLSRYLEWFNKHYPHFYPFYSAMVYTGRRPSEVAMWDWADVREEDMKGIPIHYVITQSTKAKNGRQDKVYFTDSLWDIIKTQAWRTGLIFRNPCSIDGMWKSCAWCYRVKSLKQAFPDDKILQKMIPRDTRRSLISYKTEFAPLEERLDVKVVQQVVGHESINSTERYRVANKDRVLAAIYPNHFQERNDTKTHSRVG